MTSTTTPAQRCEHCGTLLVVSQAERDAAIEKALQGYRYPNNHRGPARAVWDACVLAHGLPTPSKQGTSP